MDDLGTGEGSALPTDETGGAIGEGGGEQEEGAGRQGREAYLEKIRQEYAAKEGTQYQQRIRELEGHASQAQQYKAQLAALAQAFQRNPAALQALLGQQQGNGNGAPKTPPDLRQDPYGHLQYRHETYDKSLAEQKAEIAELKSALQQLHGGITSSMTTTNFFNTIDKALDEAGVSDEDREFYKFFARPFAETKEFRDMNHDQAADAAQKISKYLVDHISARDGRMRGSYVKGKMRMPPPTGPTGAASVPNQKPPELKNMHKSENRLRTLMEALGPGFTEGE